MTGVLKYSAETLGWQREPGPVRIWRVVEGRKKTEDGKTLRFSIQEIPEDRQIDVLNHMLTIFARDEPICRSIGVINNPELQEDFRKLWSWILGQGIVVGAFLIDESNPKPIVAGANMTGLTCDASLMGFATGVQHRRETRRWIKNFSKPSSSLLDILRNCGCAAIFVGFKANTKFMAFIYIQVLHELRKKYDVPSNGVLSFQLTNEKSHMVLEMMHQLEQEKDIRKIYNVDKYIAAFGLSVDPQFRGQGLAVHLLQARKDIGEAYGVPATSTVFSSPAAQRVAAKVGFQTLVEREFSSFKKKDGSKCYPGIESKWCKLMGKRL